MIALLYGRSFGSPNWHPAVPALHPVSARWLVALPSSQAPMAQLKATSSRGERTRVGSLRLIHGCSSRRSDWRGGGRGRSWARVVLVRMAPE